MMKGILNPGTMGAVVFNVQREELIPRYGRVIIAMTSNNTLGRVNISSSREWEANHQQGGVDFSAGSTWFALDSIRYVP
jgi:hypothetical protein